MQKFQKKRFFRKRSDTEKTKERKGKHMVETRKQTQQMKQ